MKIYVLKTVTVFTLLCFVCSSCGVMFGGSRFSGTIMVKDHPEADIYVNGNKTGHGASVGLYPRNRPLTVEIKQEGCPNKTQTFNNTFRTGTFFATLITWGLVGVIIDLGTGASFKPDHKYDKAIERNSDKDFTFTIDYSECPTTPLVVSE